MRNVDIKILSQDLVPRDIEANIVECYYFTAWQGAQRAFWDEAPENCNDASLAQYALDEPNRDGPLSLLTFCVLVLRNGFTVTGESSCASPENFDAEIGRKIAREQAEQRLWILMEYAFHTKSKGEA